MSPLLMLLLSILPQIIEFLVSLLGKHQTLNDRQRTALEQAMREMRQFEKAAVQLGCTPPTE